MNKPLTTLLTLLMLSTAPAIQAQDDISLGEPGYGGSGCPQGSASTILSPDGKSLSILFDEFLVEAGGATRKRVARKTCNIAIPVHVPQGFSVSIVDIDYRGFNSLPRGAQSRFSAEYFFAGQRGPRYSKTFRGALDDEFLIQNKLGLHALVWSACGEDVNLRVNASMMARTNRYMEETLSMVDSADVKAGIVYKIQWKRCTQGNDNYYDDFYY